ncbi:MAG: permease-like cell division protein FtsX [Lachnospiraceae bacterium]|nr:permease-like cell division protein FtsX [Candidatus Colinaster scatohippi]
MRISSFFYTIRQGFRNIFRNAWFSLASIATISSCLLLFGIFYSVVANFQNIVKNAEAGVAVTVFFDEGLSSEEKQHIGEIINSREEVDASKTTFVSADEAWEGFKEEYLGEYSEGFTENPLEDSENYEIYMKDISGQGRLVEYLKTVPGIRQVNSSQTTADALSGANRLISYISVGIIGILLAVSIFLISNTVTIGISVRKEEISIMKYIGATDFFVRAPFVIEGLIIGVIGAMIPMGLVYVIYLKAMEMIMSRFAEIGTILTFLPVDTVFSTLVPVALCVGAGIGFFGSFITVRKHLRV